MRFARARRLAHAERVVRVDDRPHVTIRRVAPHIAAATSGRLARRGTAAHRAAGGQLCAADPTALGQVGAARRQVGAGDRLAGREPVLARPAVRVGRP
jgi:hypothetical protein